jgi:hypothetical protein
MSCQPDWQRSDDRLPRKRCSLDAKRLDARFVLGICYFCSFPLELVLDYSAIGRINVQPF